tara:strand:+ start:195 stop:449 length:255 start_codon:yes stop_codon:yes gene_type:complete
MGADDLHIRVRIVCQLPKSASVVIRLCLIPTIEAVDNLFIKRRRLGRFLQSTPVNVGIPSVKKPSMLALNSDAAVSFRMAWKRH